VQAHDWRRYVAPAAFLAAVTVAVVLVRAGLERGSPAEGATTVAQTTVASPTPPAKAFWTVKAGDTFGVISAKTGVSVATIQRLNPRVSSTSLFIGERIRLR
jgi:LysM repeat protein